MLLRTFNILFNKETNRSKIKFIKKYKHVRITKKGVIIKIATQIILNFSFPHKETN